VSHITEAQYLHGTLRRIPGRTSEPMIAKSITIKARGGRSGRRVAKAVVLTSGGLPGVLDSGLSNLQGLLIAVQESAAGIVCAGQRVVPEG
jgi:hypothetical protein